MASPPDEQRGRDWQELLVTVLLVVAALGTSWSSYQATRWNGEQAKAAGATNTIRIEAARTQGQERAQTQVDVETFIAWADADQRGDEGLAAFYEDRFRDEFKPPSTRGPRPWPLTNPRRTTDAVRDVRVPGGCKGSSRSSLTPAAEASAAAVRLDI